MYNANLELNKAIVDVLLESSTASIEKWNNLSRSDQLQAKSRKTSKYAGNNFKVKPEREKHSDDTNDLPTSSSMATQSTSSNDDSSNTTKTQKIINVAKTVAKHALPIADGIVSAVWDETIFHNSSDAIKKVAKLTPEATKFLISKMKKSDKAIDRDIAEVVEKSEKIVKTTGQHLKDIGNAGVSFVKDVAKDAGTEYKEMYGGMKALLTKRGKNLTEEERKGVKNFARLATIMVAGMALASPELAEASTAGIAAHAAGLAFSAAVKAPLAGAAVGVFAEKVAHSLSKMVKHEANNDDTESMIFKAIFDVLSESMDNYDVNQPELLAQLLAANKTEPPAINESKQIRFKHFAQSF